jgi:hypothetical protein
VPEFDVLSTRSYTLSALGTLLLHERLMARQLLGFAQIALDLAFIDGRLSRTLLSRGRSE